MRTLRTNYVDLLISKPLLIKHIISLSAIIVLRNVVADLATSGECSYTIGHGAMSVAG